MEHSFTVNIRTILEEIFGKDANEIFAKSQLLQYINLKTRSANKGSKARSSFANLYAIYVIVEDYLANNFDTNEKYSAYPGALFAKLFTRQRELPFGSKLQNHALNNRMSSEFQKFFPNSEFTPILRNLETNRYWINENLLKVTVGNQTYNIARSIITIIDEYAKTKQDSFQRFITTCEELQEVGKYKEDDIALFINNLLAPNVDARLFEIVSYSILKAYYNDQSIIWGYQMEDIQSENLKLYKTGRTNANDGGIDFVMRPLGRFFQVTETLDFKKYFLDIDKIQKYPITFVIKSIDDTELILSKIKLNANKIFTISAIVDKYMACIEEVINIPTLASRLQETIKLGCLNDVLNEIVNQSKVEFNYTDDID